MMYVQKPRQKNSFDPQLSSAYHKTFIR